MALRPDPSRSRFGPGEYTPALKRHMHARKHERTDVIEWLTSDEAALHLKVKPRTLLLWVRQGKVKGYKLSGTRRHVWRFLRADLDAALFDSENQSGSSTVNSSRLTYSSPK
jgi:excisionase family DNA binding protein